MMQKLMEINDHLVRTLAECEQLRSDQKTLREISSVRLQRITELQTELRKAYAERDELREEHSKLQRICADGGRRIAELKAERDEAVEHAGRLQAELDATRKQLRDVCSAQSVESAGQSDLARDVSHYTEAAEVDTPTEPQPQPEPEPQFKPYTFAAYIVGDRIQPDALRIVWATEEWIEQSKFGIVHRMKDMHLFDNDGGCNITEYHETLTLNLKVQ